MAKQVNDVVLDAALNIIRNNGNLMVALPAEPASFAAAQSAKLAEVAMTSTDFTIADGDVSGRKVTVAAKSSIAIIATGTANHIAILDTTNSRVLYVTTCPSQALTSGGQTNFASWAAEIRDPA